MKAIGLGNSGYNEQFHKQISKVMTKQREVNMKSMKPEVLPEIKANEHQAIVRDADATIINKKYDEKQQKVMNLYTSDNKSNLVKALSSRVSPRIRSPVKQRAENNAQ